MLFFNNNYLANMKEFCIALTVTGSLLFIFYIFVQYLVTQFSKKKNMRK